MAFRLLLITLFTQEILLMETFYTFYSYAVDKKFRHVLKYKEGKVCDETSEDGEDKDDDEDENEDKEDHSEEDNEESEEEPCENEKEDEDDDCKISSLSFSFHSAK